MVNTCSTVQCSYTPEIRESDLRVYGGNHGNSDSEDWLVAVDPLEVGKGDVRGKLRVGWRGAVCRHTQVELPQLHLPITHRWNPLQWHRGVMRRKLHTYN